MTDKVQKIREEIEKIKTAHSSIDLKESNPDVLVVQVCTNLLSFIDSLQEEPVSKDLEETATNYATHLDENWSTVKDGYIAENEKAAFKAGAEWGKEQAEMQIKAQSIALAHGCSKEEPVSEDLEEASKEWLKPQLDKSYANYGEGKMMELTRFNGYDMLDAIEFGAKWKRKQMMKNAIEGEWWRCAVVLPAKYMNTDDIRSVKIIILEND